MNLSTRRKAIKARAMVNEGYKMSRTTYMAMVKKDK